jgi:hypothetical protein
MNSCRLNGIAIRRRTQLIFTSPTRKSQDMAVLAVVSAPIAREIQQEAT